MVAHRINPAADAEHPPRTRRSTASDLVGEGAHDHACQVHGRGKGSRDVGRCADRPQARRARSPLGGAGGPCDPLCVLPSGSWRVALVLGLAGYDADYDWAVWERPYVIGLSVVSEGLALSALGLVRPWGEVVPRWVPGLRGRRIPIPAVVVPAALGAVLIMLFCAYAVLKQIFGFVEPLNENGDGSPTSGPAAWALWATYAPLLAWGPLLAILTVAYYRRRRANDASAAARPEAG